MEEGQNVERQMFMDLCENIHPITRKLLTQRLNSEGNRRVFFDFTCSAPKSVSIMALTMEDARITQAHQLAARFAVKELERFTAARIRKGGSQENRETGNMVAAEFLHNSSRALDPQLHTHFTVFNCTFDPAEQRWKALQTSSMFSAIRYATEVYRNDLATRLNALGYETIRTKNAFEIKGVSPSICERFSKRAQERDAMVTKMERKLGRKISNNEIAHAVHKTRSRKLKGISTVEVRQHHLAQMSHGEVTALQVVRHAADGSLRSAAPMVGDVEDSLDYAVRHVFERRSVVPQEALLEAALVHGRGNLNLQQLKERFHAQPELIRVGREISTRAILDSELFLIRSVNDGKDSLSPINWRFVPSPKLGSDQREAIDLILQSPDRFIGLRGLAGTGKSAALSELARALSEAGRTGIFCAPTGSAADVLHKDGFEAVTLQRLLVDSKLQGRLTQHSVLVLDEAGAVGVEEMRQLFALAIKRGARVILSGDTRQHGSVSHGDALRILERHSRFSFGQLSTIRRQQQADYLQAVALAANQQPIPAFDRLDAMGDVIEQATELYQSATAAYLSAASTNRSTLMVAPTWAEIDALTNCTRQVLKERGLLGPKETTSTVFDSLSWTEAQKRDLRQYRLGQVLVFHQSSGSFARNEAVEVTGIKAASLQLRRTDGSIVAYRPDGARSTRSKFDVCRSLPLAIAPGDQLLLQANRRENRLINGQLVTVKSLDSTGAITLADGRILPSDYRSFCHGYAVTSHASQGKTVDEVFLVASARSLAAINREQFYVSISRGRQRCRIFTDNKELLRDRIAHSSSRKAALELVQLGEALVKEGFTPQRRTKEKVSMASPLPLVTSQVRRNLRPVRSTRPSKFNQLAQASTAWATHLKLSHILPVRSPRLAARPTIRPGLPQQPQYPHSHRISI